MKFYMLSEKKFSNDLADESVSNVLKNYSSTLFGFTRNEFDMLVEYDVLRIIAFYYYRMNFQQKKVILKELQFEFGLIDMEGLMDNLADMSHKDIEEVFVPLSCKLFYRLNDQRLLTIVYETIFKSCTELAIKDWNEGNYYSNYLALLNAAYFQSISNKLYVKRSCAECMQVYYGQDNFDDIINSLYEKHKGDLYWDSDVNLNTINKILEKSMSNNSVIVGSQEEYLDAVKVISNILREHESIAYKEDSSGIDRIIQNTDIDERKCINISGFECHFCEAKFVDKEYIIVYQKDNHINKIIEDAEKWGDFQKTLYYDDIRQNLGKAMVYIIYILDDDSDNLPIQLIESNKTYARKYVFTEKETIDFINGFLKDSYDEVASLSPIQTWDQILREEHLTGCMTEAYASKKVEAYLSGERFDADYVLDDDYTSVKSTNVPKIKWVKSLESAGFRNFCLNKKNLEFGQVNLFYGSNGSGKTSVLEAIEYALTSEVRRVNDFKIKLPAGKIPKLFVFDNEGGRHTFTPDFSKTNRKEIERVWYGVPISRNKSNLNDNFNRFNAFDSEAAYKFIHETDTSEGNFASMFGNLLFGETVVDHEKKWQRFKKAFDERYTELRKELHDTRSSVSFYEQILAQKNINSKSQDVEAGIVEIKLINRYKLPQSVNERYPMVLEELASSRKYADVFLIHNLEKMTFSEIQEKVTETKKKNLNFEKQKIQKTEEITKLVEQKGALKEKIFIEQQNQSELKRQLECTNEDILNWTNVENVLSHEDTIQLVQALLEELTRIEKDLNYISKIEQRPEITNFLKLDNNEKISIADKEIFEKKLAEKKAHNQELENRYYDEKKDFGEVEQQTIELRKIGKNLAIDATCPLCGHKYESTQQLLDIINNVVIVDDKMEMLMAEMQDTSKSIAEIEKILDREKLIDTAVEELRELETTIPCVRECGSNYKKLYDFVSSKNALEKRKSEIIDQQTILDSQGFSLRNISDCQEYKTKDATYLEYEETGSGTYSQFLQSRLKSIQEKLLISEDEIKEYNRQIQECDGKEELCKNEIHQIETMIDTLEMEINVEVERAVESLKMRFELPDNISIYDWIEKYRQLYDKCEYEVHCLESQEEIKFEKQMLDEYRGIVKRDEPMVERCARAVQAFEKMPALSSFVEQGIRSNIQQISRFFKQMHHSGEFEKLDIDETGLYAVRGIDHHIVRTYEMSTGQRSTIAMAVMFALHMAAPDAPKFLLLDEPLATMDDTQVLNVLDILRSMADQNTQIFFTTANSVMINLFRECFKDSSFDYREFEFIKRVNRPSEIRETSINITKSIEELTLDDLTLDFQQFAEIREILRKNQEKLISREEWEEFSTGIEEDNDVESEEIENIESTLFYSLLTNEERQILDDLVLARIKIFSTLTTNAILEKINEKALKFYGETIINTDTTLPFIENDYCELLKVQHDKFYYKQG